MKFAKCPTIEDFYFVGKLIFSRKNYLKYLQRNKMGHTFFFLDTFLQGRKLNMNIKYNVALLSHL